MSRPTQGIAGFSLLNLLVGIALSACVASMLVPLLRGSMQSYRGLRQSQSVQSELLQLNTLLLRLRAHALTLNGFPGLQLEGSGAIQIRNPAHAPQPGTPVLTFHDYRPDSLLRILEQQSTGPASVFITACSDNPTWHEQGEDYLAATVDGFTRATGRLRTNSTLLNACGTTLVSGTLQLVVPESASSTEGPPPRLELALVLENKHSLFVSNDGVLRLFSQRQGSAQPLLSENATLDVQKLSATALPNWYQLRVRYREAELTLFVFEEKGSYRRALEGVL